MHMPKSSSLDVLGMDPQKCKHEVRRELLKLSICVVGLCFWNLELAPVSVADLIR